MDDRSIRECCILAKVQSFEPMKTIYGDGKGAKHVVYFLLSGSCKLIERLQVEVSLIRHLSKLILGLIMVKIIRLQKLAIKNFIRNMSQQRRK